MTCESCKQKGLAEMTNKKCIENKEINRLKDIIDNYDHIKDEIPRMSERQVKQLLNEIIGGINSMSKHISENKNEIFDG